MASKISLDPGILREQSLAMTKLKDDYEDLFTNITKTLNETNCNWSDVLSRNFSGKITSAQKSFSSIVTLLNNGAVAAANSAKTFQSIDSQLAKSISGQITTQSTPKGTKGANISKSDKSKKKVKINWKVNDLLVGIGYLLSVGSFGKKVLNGKVTTKDILSGSKGIFKLSKYILSQRRTFLNYMKIGRAITTRKAGAYWVKKLLGLNRLTDVSKAKSAFTRFKTNFRWNISEELSKLKPKNLTKGKVAVGAVTTVLDLGLNYFDNKNEQAQRKGTKNEMSDRRVIAETVTETAVGVVGGLAVKAVVGAAVAAVFPVGAPVLAITVGIMAVGSLAFQATTGTTVTECVSDFILDNTESKLKNVGKNVVAAGKTVSAGWNKVSKMFK